MKTLTTQLAPDRSETRHHPATPPPCGQTAALREAAATLAKHLAAIPAGYGPPTPQLTESSLPRVSPSEQAGPDASTEKANETGTAPASHTKPASSNDQPSTPPLCDLSNSRRFPLAAEVSSLSQRERAGRGKGPDELSGVPDSRLACASVDPTSSRRNGKIAQLPPEIRERVNLMLRRGSRYSDMIQKLAELGYPGITAGNISLWKHGGFVDWFREQQRLEAALAVPRAIDRCERSTDIDRLQQNAITLAVDKLSIILLKFDPDRALALLYDKPQFLPSFIGSLASLAKSTADLAKAFNLAQDREALLRQGGHLGGDGERPDEPMNQLGGRTSPVSP